MYQENLSDVLSAPELWDWLHTTDAPENQRTQEVREMQEIAAALAWAVPVAEPSVALREALLTRVADETKPFVASALLTVRGHQGEWRETAPGVRIKTLFVDEDNGLVTSLYRLAPGTKLNPHRHLGHEQCYVLEGDFHIGAQVFGPGDYQCAQAGSIHEAITTFNGTLLLIVAPAHYEPLGA